VRLIIQAGPLDVGGRSWSRSERSCGDSLIRLVTALAVVAVAGVAAFISCQHTYELVTSHGETGLTARLQAGLPR
jgi:hypothetical protein